MSAADRGPRGAPPSRDLRPIADFLLALADATRLRILFALRAGERGVADVAGEVGLAPDRVSRQLARLRRAGFVACRHTRGAVCYRLANPDVLAICDGICVSLADGETARTPVTAAPRLPAAATGRPSVR